MKKKKNYDLKWCPSPFNIDLSNVAQQVGWPKKVYWVQTWTLMTYHYMQNYSFEYQVRHNVSTKLIYLIPADKQQILPGKKIVFRINRMNVVLYISGHFHDLIFALKYNMQKLYPVLFAIKRILNLENHKFYQKSYNYSIILCLPPQKNLNIQYSIKFDVDCACQFSVWAPIFRQNEVSLQFHCFCRKH